MKKLVKHLLPRKWRYEIHTQRRLWRSLRILAYAQGQHRSLLERAPIAENGAPRPWLTYPAIEYLSSLDCSACDVLEFGSGYSSWWWGDRCASVRSIESDADWCERVRQHSPANHRITLATSRETYVDAIVAEGKRYQVIVIDGMFRPACARAVPELLATGGMVVFDNSDWFPGATAHIRRVMDMLQVDFHGFGPGNDFTWTTSMLLSRDCIIARKSNEAHPLRAIGSHALNLDEDIG